MVYSESDSDDGDEESRQGQIHQTIGGETSHADGKAPIIASMSIFPKYHTSRVKRVLVGHKVMVLIDSGVSHNFTDATMVEQRGIPTEEFDGFVIVIAGGH